MEFNKSSFPLFCLVLATCNKLHTSQCFSCSTAAVLLIQVSDVETEDNFARLVTLSKQLRGEALAQQIEIIFVDNCKKIYAN
jgi:hypothetical protein